MKPLLGHSVRFFLRLIFLKNSKSSLINVNGLMDFNQNLDRAVNYIPHKRLSMCFIYFPHHTLNACSPTRWNRNKTLFLRIQCSGEQLIYQLIYLPNIETWKLEVQCWENHIRFTGSKVSKPETLPTLEITTTTLFPFLLWIYIYIPFSHIKYTYV